MGYPAPVFDAAKQQRRTVGQKHCSGVEYGVDAIGPVFAGQDRVRLMAPEQRLMMDEMG